MSWRENLSNPRQHHKNHEPPKDLRFQDQIVYLVEETTNGAAARKVAAYQSLDDANNAVRKLGNLLRRRLWADDKFVSWIHNMVTGNDEYCRINQSEGVVHEISIHKLVLIRPGYEGAYTSWDDLTVAGTDIGRQYGTLR
jgi:hypothetical protein